MKIGKRIEKRHQREGKKRVIRMAGEEQETRVRREGEKK